MIPETNSCADHLTPQERRMEEIVLDVLKAQDEGREPDRQRLLVENLDLASELIDFFAGQSNLDTLIPPFEGSRPLPAGLLGGVGDYEILEEIGHGGMGVVYKAWQVSLKRIVALKMIRDPEFCSGETIERFRREAQTVATRTSSRSSR